MRAFRIRDASGRDFGVWPGRNEADALAHLHQDAGYPCREKGGALLFDKREDRAVCGDLQDWVVEEVLDRQS